MTIERVSELYQRGLYSKFEFYLWVIKLLSQGEDPGYVMERVPEGLLDEVFEMAERHFESAGEHSDVEQQKNPEKILRWRDRRSELLAAARENGASQAATALALPDRPADRSGSR